MVEGCSERLAMLKGSLVGFLKKDTDFINLSDNLILGGFKDITVCNLGGGVVLFKSKVVGLLNSFLNSNSRWWSEWCTKVVSWSPDIITYRREAWVSCWGVPLQLWGSEIFVKIANSLGDLIKVDEETLKEDRLDRGRVNIWLPATAKLVDELVEVRTGATSCLVRVIEERFRDQSIAEVCIDDGSSVGLGSNSTAEGFRQPPSDWDSTGDGNDEDYEATTAVGTDPDEVREVGSNHEETNQLSLSNNMSKSQHLGGGSRFAALSFLDEEEEESDLGSDRRRQVSLSSQNQNKIGTSDICTGKRDLGEDANKVELLHLATRAVVTATKENVSDTCIGKAEVQQGTHTSNFGTICSPILPAVGTAFVSQHGPDLGPENSAVLLLKEQNPIRGGQKVISDCEVDLPRQHCLSDEFESIDQERNFFSKLRDDRMAAIVESGEDINLCHSPLSGGGSRASSPSSFSSFLSDLPPDQFALHSVRLKRHSGRPPNFKKPLLEPSTKQLVHTSVGSIDGEANMVALVGAQPCDTTSRLLNVDPGISSSRFSIGLIHSGEPIPIPKGGGTTQGINLAIQLESSSIPMSRLVTPVVSNIPTGPVRSRNSVIAMKVLARAKGIGFFFQREGHLEETRLNELEDKDFEARVGRENPSGVR